MVSNTNPIATKNNTTIPHIFFSNWYKKLLMLKITILFNYYYCLCSTLITCYLVKSDKGLVWTLLFEVYLVVFKNVVTHHHLFLRDKQVSSTRMSRQIYVFNMSLQLFHLFQISFIWSIHHFSIHKLDSFQKCWINTV